MAAKKPQVRKPRFEDVEGIDPQSLIVDRLYDEAMPAAASPKQVEEPGMLRSLLDSGLALGTGAVTGVKLISDAFGADNAVSRTLGDVNEGMQGLLSDYRKAEMLERQRKIAEAEASGSTMNEIGAYLGGFAEAPIDTLLNAAGTMAPTMAAMLVPGAREARLAAMLGTGVGAVQGAGAGKSSIYDAVLQRSIQEGKTEEEARALADEAQAYGGKNTDSILSNAALGGVAGGSGLERVARGLKFGAQAGQAVPGMARRVGTGALAEGIPEAGQGGLEQLSGNVALQREGYEDVPTMRGVAGSAALEGVAGGALGGAFGIPTPSQPAANTPPAPAPIVPESGPLTRAANAAPLALGYNGRVEDVLIPAGDGSFRAQTPDERDAIAAEQQRQIDLGLVETRRRKTDAPPAPTTIEAGPGDVREINPETGEVAATPPSPAFASLDEADDYVNAQIKRGGAAFGVPIEQEDGSIGLVPKGDPRYTQAVKDRLVRRKARNGASDVRPGRPAEPGPADAAAVPGDPGARSESVADAAGGAVDAGPSVGGADAGERPADAGRGSGDDALTPAPAQQEQADDAQARWTRATEADRWGILATSGWNGADPGKPSLSAQRVVRLSWDRLSDSQRSRITQGVGTRAAPAKPEPAAELPMGQEPAPRTVTVNGKTVALSPEQGAEWDKTEAEFKTRFDQAKQTYERSKNAPLNPDADPDVGLRSAKEQYEATRKRLGMELSAEHRRIAGAQTPKETAKAEKDAAAFKVGDRVQTPDGLGTVEGTPYGRVRVKVGDKSKPYPRNQVSKANAADQTAELPLDAGAGQTPTQAPAPEAGAAAGGDAAGAGGGDAVPGAGSAAVEADGVTPDATPAADPIYGEAIDDEWQRFSKASKTRAIPRADMPQIKAEHRGAMTQFLAARGIAHEQEQDADPASFKPTQAEFSRAKVEKAKAYEGGDRAILVSADDHILDGHHQWLAAREQGKPIRVIRLDAPIEKLLSEVKEFPSAEAADGAAPASEAAAAPVAEQAEAAPAAPPDVVEKAPKAEKPKKQAKAKKEQAERDSKRAAYFTPGNIVRGYSGFDRVLAYTPPDDGGTWSVRVQHVVRDGKGWAVDPTDGGEREHATEPEARHLKNGPIGRWPVEQGAEQGGDEVTQEIGPFGPILTQYKGDAQGAIKALTELQDGEAVAALSHPEIGDIDLVWGNEGTRESNGFGLSKLIKWHPEVLDDLQSVIASLKVVERTENRVQLESDKHRAAVRLEWDQKAKHWLLTAFEKRTGGDTRTDTAANGAEGDTARLDSGSASVSAPADGDKPTKKPKLTDSGDELTRNVRNRKSGISWEDVKDQNATLKVKSVTKQAVWPRPDYEKLAESGEPGWKLAALKVIYDKIAAKPKVLAGTPADAQLREYIETVQAIRDAVMAELARAQERGTEQAMALESVRSFEAKGENYVQAAALMDGFRVVLDGTRNIVDRVFPHTGSAHGGRFDRTTEAGKSNNRRALLIGGNPALRALGLNYNAMAAARDLLHDGFPAKQEAWEKSYEVRAKELRNDDIPEGERTGQPQTRFAVYIKGSTYRLAKGHPDGAFATQEQAENFARELTKKAKDDKPLPPSRGLDLADVRRTGPDWRNGKDVTTDDIKAAFGFRGVNLGEYVKANQKIAQLHVNHAFDALHDLAELAGVPPKALSLNGTLGLAIGAQGSGRALAHFVPGVNEINITRDSGAGALAHEWAHAFDHYLGVQQGEATARSKTPFLSEHLSAAPGGVRQEVFDAFKFMVNAMNKRAMTDGEVREWLTKQRASAAAGIGRATRQLKAADQAAFDAALKSLTEGAGDPSAAVDALHAAAEPASVKANRGDDISLRMHAERASSLRDEQRFFNTHRPQTATKYAENAKAMDRDRPGADYWSTNLEMFARGFEAFVMDALADKQRESLYLSGLVGSEGWLEFTERTGLTPHIQGDERIAFGHAAQTLLDTIQTREDDAGNVAMFSRRSSTRGLPLRDAQAATELIRRALPGAPNINLLQSVDNAPPALAAQIRQRGAANDVEAVYWNGEIYAFPGNFSSLERFNFVVGRHEVRHAGFEAMLGANKDATLMSIGRANRRVMLKARKLMKDGLADSFAEGVEEALADMPVEDIAALSRIKVMVGAIRRWLRAAAFKLRQAGLRQLADAIEPRKWTDNDVIAFVMKAETFSRAPAGGDGARFSRAKTVTNDDGLPEFEFADIKLAFPIPAERIEVIPVDGQQVLSYAVMPTEGFDVLGHVDVLMEDGRPVSLLDIEAYQKGNGVGAKAVEALLRAYPDQDLNISNIVPEAQGFWERMGIPTQNLEEGAAYDGTLNIETFLDAQESRSAQARAGRAGGQGQGANARAARGPFGATPKGQAGQGPAVARFSRAADAGRLSAQELVNARGGLFDFNQLGETRQDRVRTVLDGSRGFWLGAMTRDQLADVYGKEVPQVREYDQLTRKMENERSNRAQKADDLYQEWARLDTKANQTLAGIMADATLFRVDPDDDFQPGVEVDGIDEKQREGVHRRISREFAQLPSDAKAIYEKVKSFHIQTLTDLRDALLARVERQVADGASRAATLSDIRARFDDYLKGGPYFPLSRFGNYLVVANRETDGERVVAAYETAGEQQAAARRLTEDGFQVKLKTTSTYKRPDDGAAGKFIGDVLMKIEALDFDDASINGAPAQLKDQLLDDVNQLFIRALPDLSYRKHFAHRKGTPGFSSDMMRGFASSAFHAASHIARLNHGDRMSFALESGFREVEKAVEGDFNKSSQVLNELAKRHEAAMNPNTHPVAAALNSLGFVMYLGLSPAAGVINLLQNPMVTLPALGAKFGFRRASAAMTKAFSDIGAAPFNRASGFNAAESLKLSVEEREVIRELQDEGVIDLTQAHDLAAASGLDTGNVARSKSAFALARAMKIVGWTFHVPEVMNRQVAALTTYRLAKLTGMSREAALEEAREAIKRTHFDYSSSNRARFMQGNVARVVTQFKQYSQNMSYLLMRALHQSVKGESPEVRRIARRQLVATMAVTFAMAGALGLPGLSVLGGLAGLVLGGDDDEPFDWEVELRNALADTIGKDAAEVVAKGVPRALIPWDLASRVGLGDLWYRESGREGDSPREAVAAMMGNVLGPTFGTLIGGYTAVDYFKKGDFDKGLEAIVPKFIRDPLKAYRESEEGITSYGGDHLLDVDGTETIGRLLGFAPARASEMHEGRAAVMSAKTALEAKRSNLQRQIVQAKLGSNAAELKRLTEEQMKWNRRNPDLKITPLTIRKAIMARKRKQANTEDGVTLTGSREFLRDKSRFANLD